MPDAAADFVFEALSLKVQGPLNFTGAHLAAQPWELGPLSALQGTIHAHIIDAYLGFDADVTVPIHYGQIDFDDATVENVGPDARMGISSIGLYVDAPNGRTYLYQFASAPAAGVEYERRGALLGPWISDRGKLQLQALGEAVLRNAGGGHGQGITEHARQLMGRTSVHGEVHLGDGKFAGLGVQAVLKGSTEGCNTVRVHSDAVGRGLTLEIASLSVQDAAFDARGTQWTCDAITGAVTLRLVVEDLRVRFACEVSGIKLSGLRPVQAPPGRHSTAPAVPVAGSA